jgi:hypothetical protein
MKHLIVIPAIVLLAGCATTPVYGPARSANGEGYFSQQIETGRHRVSYTDTDPVRARNMALLRAAEITILEGKDWFEITNEGVEGQGSGRKSGGTSVSIGGSAGSGGYSSAGVGIGIGFPLGGGSAGKVTHSMEIVTGEGAKPDKAEAYDARSVDINLRSSAP